MNASSQHTTATAGTPLGQLFAPVDAASLAVFRVAFGATMLWEVVRYFRFGWITRYYADPVFHFSYFGFGWLPRLSATGLTGLFIVLGVAAVGIALGLCYRLAAAVFWLGFTYVFLFEAARYLNHFYLVCLLSLLMAVVPAQRLWSLDAWLWPKRRGDTVPAWTVWLLRAQVGIVYVYGGIAKLNADWLAGEPLRSWLASRVQRGLLPAMFDSEAVVYTICYGGLLFDLCIVPLLLWRRTRGPAFVLAVLFHVANSWLFEIGIFPWLMIAATTLFLSPSWPRRWLSRSPLEHMPVPHIPQRLTPRQRMTVALLCAYLAVQLAVPLRHWLYPGNVNWTEQGHRFAWRMKLRSKRGEARFYVRDPGNGEVWQVDPASFLTGWQYTQMATEPDMIQQFARHVANEFEKAQGHDASSHVEVRAEVLVSLNGRPPQLLIDPTVDLSAGPRRLGPSPWIVPLGQQPTAPPPPVPGE